MRSYSARSVEAYEKIEQVGEGTYGEVFMARSRDDSSLVALKKVKLEGEREGFPITAIREIKILKSLNHDNVINMKEIVTSKNKSSIYMVFEYMDHDLTGLAGREGIKFSIPQIKCYMQQLLTGLNYCHLNNILHRDIKGANLLIDNNGVLKLADFGLARSCALENSRALTNRVITLWYRPPELLLGTQAYGPAVDTWSAGCIFAELLLGKPILQVRVSPDTRSSFRVPSPAKPSTHRASSPLPLLFRAGQVRDRAAGLDLQAVRHAHGGGLAGDRLAPLGEDHPADQKNVPAARAGGVPPRAAERARPGGALPDAGPREAGHRARRARL
jgi:serine/threonine protein kinase